MRTMSLLLCLALAGCAGASASSTSFAPEAPKATVFDPPVLPGPTAEAAPPKRGHGKKSAKSGDDASKEEWWKEGGVTREKVNAMCWMKYEKGRADVPIDKRADLVNQCVAEALKEHPIR